MSIVGERCGGRICGDILCGRDRRKSQGAGGTCIGYHYVIRKDGTVEQGRPHWTVGAHAYMQNSHTIGIHVCGNFEIGEPTSEQIESLPCRCWGYGFAF